MKNLTVILGHANYNASIANKTIIGIIKEKYPQAEIRNIAELYPDFNIDIEKEQEILLKSDVILLQFPVNWFNMPAILKKWFDDVLAFGFAFGTATKLEGKTFTACITAGGRDVSYTPIGSIHFRLEPLFNHIECTAYYCKMNFADLTLGYGNVINEYNTPEIVKQRAIEQAERLILSLDKLLQ